MMIDTKVCFPRGPSGGNKSDRVEIWYNRYILKYSHKVECSRSNITHSASARHF
jgi:hypothetical protein